MSPTSLSAQRTAGNSAHNAACSGRESEASAISQAAAFFMIYLLQLIITIAWEPIAILELPLKPLKLRMIDCYSMANEMNGNSESCIMQVADALPGPEENESLGFVAGSSSRISLRGAKRVEPPVQGGSWNALQASAPLRINLQDLKVKFSKILGPRKEREYCTLFSSFLSQRLSKAELDKRLPQTIGKDNISLHNQIVKAILSNAICGQVPPPPPPPAATVLKNLKRRRSEKDGGVSKRSRSFVDDEDSRSVVETELQEELDQQEQDQQEDEDEEDEEEEEEEFKSRSVVTAPLGIPFCVQSIGGAAGAVAQWQQAGRQWLWDDEEGSDFLPSNAGMQRRMERVAIAQAGLQGLNSDCANLVNQALDVYLKRLIKECIQLVQSRRPKSIQHEDHRSKRKNNIISARDFKLAMELNPQQLGDNWPTQLERLSLLASLLAFQHQQQHFDVHRDHNQQQRHL